MKLPEGVKVVSDSLAREYEYRGYRMKKSQGWGRWYVQDTSGKQVGSESRMEEAIALIDKILGEK